MPDISEMNFLRFICVFMSAGMLFFVVLGLSAMAVERLSTVIGEWWTSLVVIIILIIILLIGLFWEVVAAAGLRAQVAITGQISNFVGGWRGGYEELSGDVEGRSMPEEVEEVRAPEYRSYSA